MSCRSCNPGSKGRQSARSAAVAALWTPTPRAQHRRRSAGIARRDGPARRHPAIRAHCSNSPGDSRFINSRPYQFLLPVRAGVRGLRVRAGGRGGCRGFGDFPRPRRPAAPRGASSSFLSRLVAPCERSTRWSSVTRTGRRGCRGLGAPPTRHTSIHDRRYLLLFVYGCEEKAPTPAGYPQLRRRGRVPRNRMLQGQTAGTSGCHLDKTRAIRADRAAVGRQTLAEAAGRAAHH
jgi:hypothetical protein